MSHDSSITLATSLETPVTVSADGGGQIKLVQDNDIIYLDALATRKLYEVLMAATLGFGMTEEQD